MKILVANLGSTSFKYRLFDMADERVLARGGVERIGSTAVAVLRRGRRAQREETTAGRRRTTPSAVRLCLQQLTRPEARSACKAATELAAIGFKAVHAQGVTGVQRVDERVLAAMEAYNDVAPAHNPPYVAAMRLLAKELPEIPLVAAFETGFHETIPPAQRAVRRAAGVGREARHQALGLPRREPSLHRRADGASCWATRRRRSSPATWAAAARCVRSEDGKSRGQQPGHEPADRACRTTTASATSIRSRCRPCCASTGKTLEQMLDDLANRSGLLGLSGFNDLRDIESGRGQGRCRAPGWRSTCSSASVRHYLGAYLLLLGGADAIVFTGGIGENSATHAGGDLCRPRLVRHRASTRRRTHAAKGEVPIHAADSRVQMWIMPTNEELIVARQASDAVNTVATSSLLVAEQSSKLLVATRGPAMFLAKVTGSVVATQKVAQHDRPQAADRRAAARRSGRRGTS